MKEPLGMRLIHASSGETVLPPTLPTEWGPMAYLLIVLVFGSFALNYAFVRGVLRGDLVTRKTADLERAHVESENKYLRDTVKVQTEQISSLTDASRTVAQTFRGGPQVSDQE